MPTLKPLDHWETLAGSLDVRTDAFIDGASAPAASGETFDAVSPRDGSLLGRVASCDAEDVDRAVKAARRAFDDGRWSRAAPAKRKRVLMRFADLIRANADELALLTSLEMGKPIADALTIDIPATANNISWYGEAADKLLDELPFVDPSALALVTREPAGVVGAVVPWNFPLIMASWKLGPSLAAGNSVILKPAEQSPLSALRVAGLAAEAGIPDGVFNVVTGLGPTAGQALGRHADVDVIAFTGSTEVGRMFLAYAAESNLKRVFLELGGKTANIVFPDAYDLAAAAAVSAWGIFFNQGEMCTAASRLLVHEDVHDEVVDAVVRRAARMQPGDPLDPDTKMGAIVDANQLDRVMGYIGIGQEEGATLLTGGHRAHEQTGGLYAEPAVFDGVTPTMRIAQEEIFGPVLSTLTFSTPQEAVEIANGTMYGLAASIWTRDLTLAHTTARALRAGTVWVNCFEEGDITVPFGGVKASGFGRDKSLHAFDKFMDVKTTWIKLDR
jgi:acyl-CoA reductase-like NAD-dependent aldehyde dehydrogenase